MDEAMILIGGCSSSGTTLVRSILDSHSKIACGPELNIFDRPFIYKNSFLTFKNIIINSLTAFKSGSINFDVLRSILDSGCIESKTQFHMGLSNKKPNLFSYVNYWNEVEEIARVNESYEGFFNHLLLLNTEKTIWAEKSPRNIYFIDDFLCLFPGGKFIYVERGALDTITSLMRRSFARKTIDQALKQYIKSYEAFRMCSRSHEVLHIHYESLVSEPEKNIRDICKFLDVNFECQLLEFFKFNRSVTSGYASDAIYNTQVGRWKREIYPSEYEYISERLSSSNIPLEYKKYERYD